MPTKAQNNHALARRLQGRAPDTAAGGGIRRDLFAEGDAGTYLTDATLLETLVRGKLDALAGDVRAEGCPPATRCGRPSDPTVARTRSTLRTIHCWWRRLAWRYSRHARSDSLTCTRRVDAWNSVHSWRMLPREAPIPQFVRIDSSTRRYPTCRQIALPRSRVKPLRSANSLLRRHARTARSPPPVTPSSRS